MSILDMTEESVKALIEQVDEAIMPHYSTWRRKNLVGDRESEYRGLFGKGGCAAALDVAEGRTPIKTDIQDIMGLPHLPTAFKGILIGSRMTGTVTRDVTEDHFLSFLGGYATCLYLMQTGQLNVGPLVSKG